MEIKLEKDEFILEKLAKLKCGQGCQSNANYMVFDLGLLCTLCLSKLEDVPQDHLVSLEALSKIVADLADHYESSNKHGTNLLPLKAEIEQQNKALKSLRDSLTLDVKAIHAKTGLQITQAQQHCQQQYRNQPLEDFFEPDLTVSILVNESQLFLDNLKNLKVVEEDSKVSYVFCEPDKDPETAKKNALSRLSTLESTVNASHAQVKDIMTRFRESTKPKA